MTKKLALGMLLWMGLNLVSTPIYSQCAMCRATVESNIEGEEGKSIGKGLNKGIMYLMAIPYLVLGGFGYMIYKGAKARS
jgi:hypothetical protein